MNAANLMMIILLEKLFILSNQGILIIKLLTISSKVKSSKLGYHDFRVQTRLAGNVL